MWCLANVMVTCMLRDVDKSVAVYTILWFANIGEYIVLQGKVSALYKPGGLSPSLWFFCITF